MSNHQLLLPQRLKRLNCSTMSFALASLKSTVKLPRTGFEMPILGLGVYQNEECTPAVKAALELGYRHIDSARMYRNEAAVAEGVRLSGVPREAIFITSKVYHNEFGYDATLNAVNDSVKNFGFDYIDLYLIHAPIGGKEKRLETYRALLKAQEQGLVKTIGVSNYGPRHIDEIEAEGLPLPSVNQIELHPLDQQKPIVDYCKTKGIVVEAYTPLLRGDFSNPVLQEVSKTLGKDPAQILVRWALQRGFIPLPKSATPSRIASNADVFGWSIPNDLMAKLDAIDMGDAGAITWNPIHVD